MEPIVPISVQSALDRFAGQTAYLHLETTNGSYAEGSAGASTQGTYGTFIRNAPVLFSRGVLAGSGPYRAGLQIEHGWIYAQGLTHWELDSSGHLLLAGHDDQGRLTVALELSPVPFGG